jgi:hypothetical protein
MLKIKTENKHDAWLFEQFKDAKFVEDFLQAAREDSDPETYLLAFKKVVDSSAKIQLDMFSKRLVKSSHVSFV